jgi:hypothetical protein
MQVNVGQQWRDDSSLRRTARVRPGPSSVGFLDDRCAQPGFDEFEDHPVAHAPGHPFHQFTMRDRIEVFRQVGINHLGLAHPQRFSDLLDGLVGIASGPKAKGARMKIRLEYRHQHQIHRHLRHAIFHRGNAQCPLSSSSFRNLHSSHRRRPVGLRSQFLPHRFEPLLFGVCILGNVLDGSSIDSGCSPIRFHTPPCCKQHIGALHFSIQTPKPITRFGFRFPIQDDLQLPNFIGRW